MFCPRNDGGRGTPTPLIIEGDRWSRAALLELADSQHEGLVQFLDLFSKGQVPFPTPWAGEAAMNLMRAGIALRESMREDASLVQLVALVNVQYETMNAVTRLVPSTLLRDRAAKKKAEAASHPKEP